MRAARAVIGIFAKPIRPIPSGFALGPVSISISGLRDSEKAVHLLLIATLTLDRRPRVVKKDLVRLSDGVLSRLNNAVEDIANLISVVEDTSRILLSPTPSFGLLPDDDADREWLASRAALEISDHSKAAISFQQPTDLSGGIALLGDRLGDGVLLMAEALALPPAGARFRDLMRMLERAFRLAGRGLIDPLTKFLRQAPYEFTRDEVVHWIADLRHGMSHADVKDTILLDSAPAAHIPRVQLAARDVLFNKEH
jgi:hypothetical protein